MIKQQVCHRAVMLFAVLFCLSVRAQSEHVTINRFVAHESSVPANAGERVGLYLREKVGASTLEAIREGEAP